LEDRESRVQKEECGRHARGTKLASIMAEKDIAIALTDATPKPLIKYLRDRLVAIGLDATELSSTTLVVGLPDSVLEAHATTLEMEKRLKIKRESLKNSEQDFPMRVFKVSDREAFAKETSYGLFTPAERAFVGLDYLDTNLLCDDTLWNAALVAAGRADAAAKPDPKWLIGAGDSWTNQPLLGALSSLDFLECISPMHGPGVKASVGLPLEKTEWMPWLRRACQGDLVSIHAIRSYWGEGVAFYFAWQSYYLKMLLLPALAGFAVWLLRPADVSVDDDPNASLFSLFAVVWGILFVTTWQSREAELAFTWGTASSERTLKLRPDYVGVQIIDPVTFEPRLYDPPMSRAIRYTLSFTVTALSLLVPVGAMLASLNLQGYIVPSTGAWMGFPVQVPFLAKFAEPGEVFDPLQDNPLLPLVPVILHAITIQVLNALFKSVAHALTRLENQRSERAFEASMLLKRFAFEASDCYLALFYIAFELQDVPKLRAELVALFTADTVRRVLLETVVPMVLVLSRGASAPKKAKASSSGAAAGGFGARASAEGVKAEMELDEYEDFDDYLEMVIQLGYVVLFASAMPLAPTLCLVCNAIELLADSIKLTYVCRRPRPVRATSIGGWGACMYVLVIASIYTNLFIMGVASDQMAAVFPSLFHVPAVKKVGGGPLGAALRGVGLVRGPAVHSGEHEMRAGMGRFVVLLLGAMEHALLLVLLASQAFLTQPPAWVKLAMARRDHEEKKKA